MGVAGIRVDVGIIPAYAGSTLTVCCWVRGVKDHPRIRGEHVDRYGITCPIARIIPAYAGSTGLAGAGVRGEGDHPRIRGEHVSMVRRCK